MAIESKPMRGRVVLTGEDAAAFMRQIANPTPLTADEIASREHGVQMAREFASKGYVTIATAIGNRRA